MSMSVRCTTPALRNLYWADSRVKRLEVAMLDGRYRKHLVKTDLGHPSAVAVNPRLGMLYWADCGDTAKIECSWLDGQERKVLVADGLGWPTGLSIDFTNGDRIYWSDSKESRIESVLPLAEDRRTAVYIDVRNPFSVSVFEDHVYWSTQEKGEVFQQDKFGRGTKTKLLTAGPWLTQVSVYQQQRYNSIAMKNPCKGTCSHLCLLRPGGYTCACPEGTSFIPGSNTECDAGFEPPPTMPPTCQCQNGGLCYFDDNKALCKCPPEWKGEYCQTNIYAVVASSIGIAIGVTVVIVALLVALVYATRKKSNLLERLRNNMPSMLSVPSMPSMPNLPSFRNGSSPNASETEGSETRLNSEVVPRWSVSMVDVEGKSFENPTYEAGEQPASTSMQTGTSAPDGPNKKYINNPLYVEEVQVVEEPTRSANQPATANKEAFQNPAYGSEMKDGAVSSAQPAATSAQQKEPIGDDSFVSFKNPIYTENTLAAALDSDI